MRSYSAFIFPLLLLSLSACSGGGTQGGNPIVEAQSSAVAIQLAGSTSASVSSLVLCAQSVKLVPTDPGATPVITQAIGEVTAGASGAQLGTALALPRQSYSQVELELDSSCASGKSVQLTNTHSSYSVADTVTVKFTGSFTVSSSTTAVLLGIQPIVDQLASATSNAQTASILGTTDGQVTPVTAWKPDLVTSWQIQLTTPVDTTVNASIFVIDLFDNDASVVSALHALGRHVLCSISFGTWESERSDAGSFPSSVIGNSVGAAGENWLDIRQITTLAPLMEARLDQCKTKGFDAVDADNLVGYSNSSGFPLTAQDQIAYNEFIAAQAHARGLSVALQDDIEQTQDLLAYFDFSINEQCFQFNECNSLLPFIQSGKAVFEMEYNLSTSQFCAQANAMNFNSIKKSSSLNATVTSCR